MCNKQLVLSTIVALSAAMIPSGALADGAEVNLECVKEIPVGGSLSLENLLGTVILRGGAEGRAVRVEARVIAEAKTEQEARTLAESVRLDATESGGAHSVHVAFPVDRHAAYRLPKSVRGNLLSKWVAPVLDRDTVAVEYDGQLVRVGPQRGAASLSVELSVTLPMDISTSVRQIVGSIHGSTSRGELHLEVMEGKILADHLYGSLHARSGGGQVEVTSFYGDELGLQTVSGDLDLAEIETDRVRLTTGSGQIQISGITVDELQVESSSGDVKIQGLEPVKLSVSTGSGEIDLEPNFKHTREATIESVSGDVTLRVTELASFDLRAKTKSGEVKAKGLELEPREPRQGTMGYRCGVGGTEVQVSAGGGELTVRRM